MRFVNRAQEEVQCPLTVLFRAISSCTAQLKSEDRKGLLSSHEAKQHAEKTLKALLSFPGSVGSTAEEPNLDPPSKARRRGQATTAFAPGQSPESRHQKLQKDANGGALSLGMPQRFSGRWKEGRRLHRGRWGGWELGRSKERQRVSSPPPPVTPVPPSVGAHVDTTQRQVDEPGLSPNGTLPS